MSLRRNYHSYLLRLWATQQQGQTRWRAMVEDPQTREQITFSSLERLFAFLQEQTTPPPPADGAPEPGRME